MKDFIRVSTAAIALIGFLLLFFNFSNDTMVAFDKWASEMFLGIKEINFFSLFGDPWFVIMVSLILLVFLFLKKNYRGLIFVLITVAGGAFLNNAIKEYVARVRPELPHQLTSYSFPSGHAMISILYLFTVAYFASEYIDDRKKSVVIWIVASVLTILIGLSRIAGNHHYGTDVVAGWAIGYFLFMVVVYWYEYLNRSLRKRSKRYE
ncbi:phosphatase PAP2 family protein [Paenisporosarcina cavernae]|uniref:Phosphatase PAP2 family protein n=1 Tax=Paenisporosarcina cavernae TaxID=2320858 RepID=A0A385YWZ2_9BACL|nr:phosphatase PAP2 family protein [Paenisporosarcina cavernae]AYC30427.1 phosphatase PAP2 family protein [Paenisporosarcina cavernae]